MENMFCFQCEQVQQGTSCTVSGACGKTPEVSNGQDALICALISLAQAAQQGRADKALAVDLILDGLFTTVTNVSFDYNSVSELTQAATTLAGVLVIRPEALFFGNEDVCSLRSTLLFGLKGMASYAYHARALGKRSAEVDDAFISITAALAKPHSINEWIALLMELGRVNHRCMATLDLANTMAHGNPTPVNVPLTVKKGPFIVVSGHDLHDLDQLLDQTDDKGVNVYTHSEMLPAHSYPNLKKHPQLQGNFGTAWHNQQREFENLPAPVLFTSNCLMPVKPSYRDRVYTTSVVRYPGTHRIRADKSGRKDFTPLIKHALDLGGYDEEVPLSGINGGTTVTTGFGRNTILSNAPAILDAVNKGLISHFFLVGGCDGAKSGRNYFTEFVKQTPKDSLILTLACGKFRFNDLDLGSIGPFPRILDMGQCNDAYGAIEVALALANALQVPVNELPLTMVLSWYEQKAVCILLTLLSLGIKNIYLGPTWPAFFSESVKTMLTDMFELHPITTPEQDLAKMLG